MLDHANRRSLDVWLAVAIATGTLTLLVATIGNPVMTWDEGYSIQREARMREWFRLLISPPQSGVRGRLFDDNTINGFWRFAREEPDGHPPFYAVIGNLGWLAGHSWLQLIPAHRLGPIALFSFTLGVMYLFLARRWGRLAAVTACGAWLLMPRVFAHAHLASYDMPLACLWFLVVVAFWKAREGWIRSFGRSLAWSVVFAIVLALAAATKFTGWLIPMPIFAWSAAAGVIALRRDDWSCHRNVAFFVVFLFLPTAHLLILIHSVGTLQRAAATLESVPNEDSQQRAARAADSFRSKTSLRSMSCTLYGNPASWLWFVAVTPVIGRWLLKHDYTDATTIGSRAVTPVIRRWILKHGRHEGGDATAAEARREMAKGWGQFFWKNPSVLALTTAAALTPGMTVALVPNWWHDPLRGVAIFLWSNLTRQQTTFIPTEFFGTRYEFSLPWYNTLAWVALTVPPLTLLLILFGVVCAVVRRGKMEIREFRIGERGIDTDRPDSSVDCDPRSSILNPRSLAWLLLLNAATLLVIRALPNAPGHDGERQLLGSFPFLACLAGLGAEWLRSRLARWLSSSVCDWIVRAVVALSFLWSAAAVWHYRSAPLSYYTELVGGVRGAVKLGLEPTYYWDSFDDRAIDWLNQHTPPGDTVLFCNYPDTLFALQDSGKLRVQIRPDFPGEKRWYVLQNRPGLFAESPWNRWLAEHGRAAYTCKLDGVPLIWIFPYDEYEKAIDRTR